ncbi:MAG: rod shape-determining protein RodA [Firmicutes bacterium]|nr:rod shape-determining protein RodA [Bacillota bacterium]
MNTFSYVKNIDKIILVVILALAVMSILMIGSTTVDSNFFSRSVIVQMIAYGLGTIGILIVMYFNYTAFQTLDKLLYALALILLLSVYVPGLGIEQFGARAWIDLGFIAIQPSELVKLLFILIMASYLDKHKDQLYNFQCLIKAGLIAAPIILIVLKEDLGSALVFMATWLIMIFFAGIDIKALGKLFALCIAAVPVAYLFLADYQKERIESFLHPNNLSLQGNWQVWQSKVAIGSGGFSGQGLFHGTQKSLDFIPVQTSDFIFSVIGEELGLIGGLIVITLFAILLIRMMRLLFGALDFFGALIISGVIGMFTFQIFENIAMTMGMMPVTGITLPFLSYGGSSILSNMIAVGLVLSVGARSKKIQF